MITASPSTCQAAAKYLLKIDPVLAPIIKRAGVAPLTPHSNYYQSLVESIISQQLSVKAAATILKRFLTLFPGADFPQPGQILEQDIETLRSVGLSRQKGAYIQDLAVKVIEKTVQFDHLDSLSNDEIIRELTQIKGVGIWTVHMFLMFCMGRLDVLPVGDLGIKNGIFTLYGLTVKPTPDEIAATADKYQWHPYASVASWYIWYSLDNKPAVSV
ncbi:DNA-3-methyladenine glycosylase 2 family protein [Candidatus Saccharibacteria bacterium]|nr:DNA-3-methyladenine glycosylase 2 family protein [Candidatus Saccharibacteria bacterium]